MGVSTMSDTYWRTYKGEQARQVHSGLQILLDKNLLGDDEKELAHKIQSKLRNAMQKEGGEYTMIPFSAKQDELLNHVEGSLWR